MDRNLNGVLPRSDVASGGEREMTMRKTVAAVALVGLVGCQKQTGSWRPSAGTVALSPDGTEVYVVDHDRDAVIRADAASGAPLGEVAVGANPDRLLVGPDGRVFVTNAGDRSVSVLEAKTLREITRVAVDIEPHGLSLTDDGKQLLVVSATARDTPEHGTLTAIDLATLQPAWSTDVGEEPRGVAVVGQKAWVTNFKQGRLTVVDLTTRRPAKSVELSNDGSSETTAAGSTRAARTAVSAGLVADVTRSPSGDRVYAPHVWQRNAPITAATAPGGYYEGGGPCGVTSIVSSALTTVDVEADAPQADDLSGCRSVGGLNDSADYPPSAFLPDTSSGSPSVVLQGPTVAVVDPSDAWMFVVEREANNVVVMATHKRPLASAFTGANVSTVVQVGAGPDGLALSADGKTAYVYAQFDKTLSLIRHDDASSDPTALREVKRVRLADDVLPAEAVEGRKLFHSAVDPRISSRSTGVACSSCHAENGREDGHVWRLPDGPRQTPSLAGRMLEQTAPYHWSGVFPGINAFYEETLVRRMGGSGLDEYAARRLTAWVEVARAPENPLRGNPEFAPVLARGKAAFKKADCATCHQGEPLADQKSHDVGTAVEGDLKQQTEVKSGFRGEPLKALDTPSLHGLGRTAPYLHDGRTPSIRGRLLEARNRGTGEERHGDTSKLSESELLDLERYLQSL